MKSMVITQVALQPETNTLKIVLPRVRWQTFQALMQNLSADSGYQIAYSQEKQDLILANSHLNGTQDKFILSLLGWQTYRALMQDVGDARLWRVAYAEGVLEIRMPRQQHEQPKIMLANFVEAIADALEIEILELGALLLEREDLARSIEPDTCFYVTNESVVRGKIINLQTDPPPDLAIESDHTSSSLNKYSIYASLGVPELWRYSNNQLEVYILQNGEYQLSQASLLFPFLPIAAIPDFIERGQDMGQRTAVRLFRERIQALLVNSSEPESIGTFELGDNLTGELKKDHP
jgi:Uma2 family endonuclease